MRRLLLLALACLALPLPVFGQCTASITNGQDLDAAVGMVANGGSVCLGIGTYVYDATVSKSSMTTVRLAVGVTQAQVTITTLVTGQSNNIKFDGMTVAGFAIGDDSNTSTNIQIVNFKATGPACIHVSENIAMHILIDHGDFTNVPEDCNEGRLGIHGLNLSYSVDADITVSNTVFAGTAGGAQSDGVMINGSPRGITIGPNNYFHDILEGTCGVVHCDAIQFYGADRVRIVGNLFSNNSTGIMSPDCNGDLLELSDNIIYQEPGSAANAVLLSGLNAGTVIKHNTFGPNSDLLISAGNPGNCVNGATTIANNIAQDGISVAACASCTQTNNISNPTYMGGSVPATWAGWELTAGSAGKGTATDGGDVGARTFGNAADVTAPAVYRLRLKAALVEGPPVVALARRARREA